MSKTVYFYNIGIYHNEKLTGLSFLDFADKIKSAQSNRNNVLRKVNEKIIASYPFAYNKNDKIRVMPFGKFRLEFKPFVGDFIESDLLRINKKIIELTTIYYNDTYRTACIVNNPQALRILDIEEYFNSFFENDENNKWEIIFQPIIVNRGIEKIKKSKQIKTVQLALNLKSSQENFIKKGIDENDLNAFNVFTRKVKNDFQANTLSISFGIGKGKKQQTIDLERMFYFLDMLSLDNDIVKTANVVYMDDTTEIFETAKLKKENVEMSRKLDYTGGTPAPEYLSTALTELFDNNTATIIREYRNFIVKTDKGENMEYVFNEIPKDINYVDISKLESMDEEENDL